MPVVRDHYGPPLQTLTKLPPRADGIRFWWLGQAGFAVEAFGTRILIDPYLSDSLAEKYRGRLFPHTRLHPAPIEASTLVGISAVLHSHGHTDHLDGDTIRALAAANAALHVAPRAVKSVALERGIPADHLLGVTAGDRVQLSDQISVEALPSAHETLEQDEAGDYRSLGYVIDLGGTRIYHSGDCVPYEGLAESLRAADVHVALLPINGRDEYRSSNGVPGNFTIAEAVELTRAAGIPSLVGHHFGLFDFNTIDPDAAREHLRVHASDLDWTLPSVGLTYRINATNYLSGGSNDR